MSKPFRTPSVLPKPWKGWLPARMVLELLSVPSAVGEVASRGLQAIEEVSEAHGPETAWSKAISELSQDPRPVLFSTVVDTATYLAIVRASQAHGFTLEQGMTACLHEGLISASQADSHSL
jgi:hypothetical protein